ncbi:MAG: flagellar biosynthesis protein FlhF [Methylococcales bacterium]
MKIKRFFAPDIRQAMKMVKEELGADAVIMSNKSVDGGVEIVAARDFDEQVIQNQMAQNNLNKQQAPVESLGLVELLSKKLDLPNFEAEKNRLHVVSSPRKPGADNTAPERPRRNIDQYVGYAEKVYLRDSASGPSAAKPTRATNEFDRMASTKEAISAKINRPAAPLPPKEKVLHREPLESKSNPVSEALLLEMSRELKSLRSAMDSKLANISQLQTNQNTSVRADLLKSLAGMSISNKLSVKIANRLTHHTDAELAFTQAQDLLSKVLPIEHDQLLDQGGIVALVGPTGVGKTTTIAKLAAKFILKHGPRQVALITTDNYRIGAHEQLNTYARILDIPVRVASSAFELRNLIQGFSDKRLVLIDTAGMSQRGMKLVEQINTLQESAVAIKTYLVMSAATEYKAMHEIINAFQVFEPQACILTKLDEAATVGAAISAIVEQNLPLSFVTDGQQVPEDIHSPSARNLIDQCVAELEMEINFNDMNNEAWVAQGYA